MYMILQQPPREKQKLEAEAYQMIEICLQSTDPIGGKNFSPKCQNAPYRVGDPIGGTFLKKKSFFPDAAYKTWFYGHSAKIYLKKV